MRVLVDMDEVVCDFVGEFCKRVGRKREEVTTFDVSDCLGIERKRFCEVISDPTFFRSLDPIEGALDGLKAVRDAGHELVVVTTISDDVTGSYDAKLDWLKAHLPWFDVHTSFVTAKRKSLVRGDLLLDDNVKNLRKFPGVAVAMARPWNVEFDGARVDSWPQFVDLLAFLKGVTS